MAATVRSTLTAVVHRRTVRRTRCSEGLLPSSAGPPAPHCWIFRPQPVWIPSSAMTIQFLSNVCVETLPVLTVVFFFGLCFGESKSKRPPWWTIKFSFVLSHCCNAFFSFKLVAQAVLYHLLSPLTLPLQLLEGSLARNLYVF